MTREQIERALEYKDESMLKQLHNRNKQLSDMSVEISTFKRVGVKMTPPFTNRESSPVLNIKPNTLLYNEDGIYEITFLSRQPRANEFRAWVRERIKEIRNQEIF